MEAGGEGMDSIVHHADKRMGSFITHCTRGIYTNPLLNSIPNCQQEGSRGTHTHKALVNAKLDEYQYLLAETTS